MSPTATRYSERYLNDGAARLRAGKLPLTIQSFLHGALAGKAKMYSRFYVSSLHDGLRPGLIAGEITAVLSAHGSEAFMRTNELAEIVDFGMNAGNKAAMKLYDLRCRTALGI